MIRCILIDDEADSLEVMEMLLKTYCPQVKIEAVCNSAEKGIVAINQFRPDVVFLDIEMPNMNGFDMLEHFDELFFNVVFITAYHQFAIKAFRYSALNYLLKPVDPEDLLDTIRRIEKNKAIPLREQMDLLMQSVNNKTNQTISRIALTTSYGMLFVETKDIVFCESNDNYTNVKLAGGQKLLISKTLKEIDQTLSGPDFYRIHNSFLINLGHIQKFVKGDGGYVVMNDETIVSISRTKKQEFLEMFSRF
ncbi:MAG: LytTR family DNA-binding domain-containing protein [Ferruginibacter sp.]